MISPRLKKTRILLLGAGGMLGRTLFRYFSGVDGIEIFGSVRSEHDAASIDSFCDKKIFAGVDVLDEKVLSDVIIRTQPDIVLNCVGIVKQHKLATSHEAMIRINALLPHVLARLAAKYSFRLVHVSTDCVFSGDRGDYSEADVPDGRDLYARSKYLGEVSGDQCLTIRTSIIGPELGSAPTGLLAWVKQSEGTINGYVNAQFTGLTTLELGRILGKHIIPNPNLSGLWHIAGPKISKRDLITLICKRYRKALKVVEDRSEQPDRSLDASHFESISGYKKLSWVEMLDQLYKFESQEKYFVER